MNFLMTEHDDFDNENSLLNYLAHQLAEGKIALFLGAGISKPVGLPDWENLIINLFKTQKTTPPSGDFLEQAEYFRLMYCKDDDPKFLKLVWSSLYNGVSTDFFELRKNITLEALASLVMLSRRGSAKVITFNFDDILETYLSYHGFVVSSIYNEKHWIGNSDVIVYHPHGYLPFQGAPRFSSNIVFDESSYSQIIGKDKPWRQQLLSVMSTHTCLFIGLSRKDANFKSLLFDAKDIHASSNENTLFWGITFSTETDEMQRALWQERGVFYKKINDYDLDLPVFLFKICQIASSFKI